MRRWLSEIVPFSEVTVVTTGKELDKLDAQVVIISYDLMARLVNELAADRSFRVIIMVCFDLLQLPSPILRSLFFAFTIHHCYS